MSKLKSLEELFAGRHFERDVIILYVRWCLRYKLSLRDLVEMAAAKMFFRKASKHQRPPPKAITFDGYAASHRAVREMEADGLLPEDTKARSSKYLNNIAKLVNLNQNPEDSLYLWGSEVPTNFVHNPET